MSKKLLAVFLAVVMAAGLLPGTARAANSPQNSSSAAWSFPALSGGTVTQDTYKGKTQVLIFVRANGICPNSNSTMKNLVNAAWIKSDDVQVIAVGVGESGEDAQTVKAHAATFKQNYAPNCEDIVFCYATSSQFGTALDTLQPLIGGSPYSIAFTLNYVFDSSNNLRAGWEGGYSVSKYESVLAKLKSGFSVPDGLNSPSTPETYEVKLNGAYDYDGAYEIFESVNSYRKANGLSELVMDKNLLEAAMQRAAECAVYYDHTRPDGSNCFTVFPAAYTGFLRENIAVGYPTADEAMTGWKNSSGHNANILGVENSCAGIGAFVDSSGTRYWVQLFTSANGTAESSRTLGAWTATATVTAESSYLDLKVSNGSTTLKDNATIGLKVGETVTLTVGNKNAESNYTSAIYTTYAEIEDTNVARVSIGTDGKAVVTPVGRGATTVELGLKASGNNGRKTVKLSISVTDPSIPTTKLGEHMFWVDTSNETYDGTPKTKLIDGMDIDTGLDLVEGEDYTVTYTNNIEVGKATITITGIGRFSGKLTYTFTIKEGKVTEPPKEPEPEPEPGPVTPAPAIPATGTAYAFTETWDLDGKKVTFQTYALPGANGGYTNYIKVRDLADALNGTAAQFNVEWAGGVTNLAANKAYTNRNGSEGITPFSGNRSYTLPTSATNVNGAASDLTAFQLKDDNGGGHTYYQLRDLGKALGFNVGWSTERGGFIETDKPYTDAD